MTFMSKFKIFLVFVILLSVTFLAYGQRNVCNKCKAIAAYDAVECPNCGNPLNKCLDCGTENKANADFCVKCSAPLAEMRLLTTIASDTRIQLKLGQSDRALAEKEIARCEFLAKENPEEAEVYYFKKAKELHKMKFYAKEAIAWEEFLTKYPDSKRRGIAENFLSEALRKWGYLFYSQKNIASATEKFWAATEVNPENSIAWEWLGTASLKKGDKKRAAEAYLNALKSDKGNKKYIYLLKKLKANIPAELKRK